MSTSGRGNTETVMATATAPKKSMTQSEIYKTLADATQLTKAQVKSLMTEMSSLAYKQAKNGFVVPGLGKLVLAKSAPREMVMRFGADAGKTKKIPAKTRVKFRLSKAAKDAILGSK